MSDKKTKTVLIGDSNHNQVCRMPVDEVLAAVEFVDSDLSEICSNHTDFVATVFYLCDSKGIPCVLKYQGKPLANLEAAYEIFNESYSLMDRICKDSPLFREF